jgi:hypothetical protein
MKELPRPVYVDTYLDEWKKIGRRGKSKKEKAPAWRLSLMLYISN